MDPHEKLKPSEKAEAIHVFAAKDNYIPLLEALQDAALHEREAMPSEFQFLPVVDITSPASLVSNNSFLWDVTQCL